MRLLSTSVFRPATATLLACSLAGFAGSTLAAPLTGQEVLEQFNLVVLGNAVSSSHVHGRSFIAGTLSGSGGEFVHRPLPASDYAGLTVGGSATGIKVNGSGAVIGGNLTNSTVNSGSSAIFGSTSNVTLNGPYYIGGTKGSGNYNGASTPSLATGTAAQAATSTDFGSVLTGLSTQLSQLSSTGSSVSIAYGKATFNAVADANGVAVFDLTSIDTATGLFGASEFAFNLNGATTLIFNSDATSATIGANFLGGSAQTIGALAVWNFYNATSLTINNQFGGSVLAPLAAFTNKQDIEGGVYVSSLNQLGEIHLLPFTGTVTSPVPEPETYAMLLAGLGLLGLIGRRRKQRAA